MKREDSSGYALIELLIVALIVGLLAAALIPTAFKTIERVRQGDSVPEVGGLVGAPAESSPTDPPKKRRNSGSSTAGGESVINGIHIPPASGSEEEPGPVGPFMSTDFDQEMIWSDGQPVTLVGGGA